ERLERTLAQGSLAHEQEGARAVTDARCVGGSDRSVLAKRRLQAGEPRRVPFCRPLVALHGKRLPLLLRNESGLDLGIEAALPLGSQGPSKALPRIFVLL